MRQASTFFRAILPTNVSHSVIEVQVHQKPVKGPGSEHERASPDVTIKAFMGPGITCHLHSGWGDWHHWAVIRHENQVISCVLFHVHTEKETNRIFAENMQMGFSEIHGDFFHSLAHVNFSFVRRLEVGVRVGLDAMHVWLRCSHCLSQRSVQSCYCAHGKFKVAVLHKDCLITVYLLYSVMSGCQIWCGFILVTLTPSYSSGSQASNSSFHNWIHHHQKKEITQSQQPLRKLRCILPGGQIPLMRGWIPGAGTGIGREDDFSSIPFRG